MSVIRGTPNSKNAGPTDTEQPFGKGGAVVIRRLSAFLLLPSPRTSPRCLSWGYRSLYDCSLARSFYRRLHFQAIFGYFLRAAYTFSATDAELVL